MTPAAPRVAFQGELGAFSEEAVRRFFDRAEPVGRPSFVDVVESVAAGRADYGMLPVENTLHGGVSGAYDALIGADVRVLGEVVLPIRHCLLAVAGATLGGLERVISHPVALAQCTRYLSSLAGVEVSAVYDTAGAARDVAAAGDRATAAVASYGAGKRYGLTVLAEDIQDRADNQTRFFVLGPATAPPFASAPGAPLKTAVLCETTNTPGALLAVLQPFANQGINLTKLESRPGPTPWTYRFFLEYEAPEGTDAASAVAQAASSAVRMDVLGTFAPAHTP